MPQEVLLIMPDVSAVEPSKDDDDDDDDAAMAAEAERIRQRRARIADMERRRSKIEMGRKDEPVEPPPSFVRRSPWLEKAYYVNHKWKSVVARLAVVLYMSVIWWTTLLTCDPWYEFAYYLTLQGWTLELVYFAYTLYLDLLMHYYGDVAASSLSPISKAAAQALSEVVFALQVVIVLFFWAVVWPAEPWRSILWEFNCHGCGLLFAVVDYLYRFTGFRLRNHRFVLAFVLLYSSLYCYVVLYLGRTVYPGMDLRSVRSVLIFFAAISSVVITHKTVYLITNWRWIKEDVKSLFGLAKIILYRQNSIDMIIQGVPELGQELLSLSTAKHFPPVRYRNSRNNNTSPRRNAGARRTTSKGS